jgi:small subunit ribosomal protein S15
MPLTQDEKAALIKQFGSSDKDTGSTAVQVAMLSKCISELTEHLKEHPKDFACRRGLVMMVGKRRRLMNYYKKKTSPDTYKALLNALNLRK